MKLVLVKIMQELHRFESTAFLTLSPVPLAILNAVTPKASETASGKGSGRPRPKPGSS